MLELSDSRIPVAALPGGIGLTSDGLQAVRAVHLEHKTVAVSYTHLDVYKRQGETAWPFCPLPSGGGSARPESRRGGWQGPSPEGGRGYRSSALGSPRSKIRGGPGHRGGCLLYTSRLLSTSELSVGNPPQQNTTLVLDVYKRQILYSH